MKASEVLGRQLGEVTIILIVSYGLCYALNYPFNSRVFVGLLMLVILIRYVHQNC